MQVHALYLYPVKSLAGIPVDSFSLDDFGPAGDRRWMIVDAEHQFVTQRSNPELARVGARFDGPDVVVDIPEQGEYRLTPGQKVSEVVVWRDRVSAVSCAGGASEALSRFCGKSVEFVYMTDETFRRVDPDRVPAYRRVSFADGFPFLVTTTASLDDLNGRLDQPVDMRRFRPNMVVSGTDPWAEDHWETLVAGSLSLTVAKPCSRCVLTTVDPDSGVRSPDGQPLKTLAGFRRTPEGVIFGVNAMHHGRGTLTVGDSVTIP
jgi:uncharacterized protein YcbX